MTNDTFQGNEASSKVVLHPINTGSVSPVPSLHFQVHEPPSSLNINSPPSRPDSSSSIGRRTESPEVGSIKGVAKRVFTLSPLNNRTSPFPIIPTEETNDDVIEADTETNLDDDVNDEITDDIWYTEESKRGQASTAAKSKSSSVGGFKKRFAKQFIHGKRRIANRIRRSKGYWSDLDRIELASPLGPSDRRRHSLILNQWLQAWQDFNGPENRRLLPDLANGVHIIDGVGAR